MPVVFRFRIWDATNDEYKNSRRWATKAAIEKIGGDAMGEGITIDESLLGREVDGMTDRDFNPRPQSPQVFR